MSKETRPSQYWDGSADVKFRLVRSTAHGISGEDISGVMLTKDVDLEITFEKGQSKGVQDAIAHAAIVRLSSEDEVFVKVPVVGPREATQRLLSELVPESALALSPGLAGQTALMAQTVSDIGTEFGYLTANDVADRAQAQSKNRAATASRWRKDHRIVGVLVKGEWRYPAFQFGPDGQPLQVIREIYRAYGDTTPQGLMVWLVAASGWLDGQRPVDLLESDPDLVVAAAGHAVGGAA